MSKRSSANGNLRRLVRILATDAREVARILDNELSHGLLDDDAEWEMAQLLARLRAAINNPNASVTGAAEPRAVDAVLGFASKGQGR